MKVLLSLITFIAIFAGSKCQVYYQPVQVLIPTINGTNLATNHSIYNNTYTNNNPYNNGNTNNRPPLPPAGFQPNNNYYQNNQNTYNGTQDGHLILGAIQPFDRLLYNQEFTKLKRWWTYREKIIEYPKDLPAGYSRHEIITSIRIINNFLDGPGAKARIEDGGIGRQFVKIKLVSPFGKGLRYNVKIYGR